MKTHQLKPSQISETEKHSPLESNIFEEIHRKECSFFALPPLPEGYCNYELKLKLGRKIKYETTSIPPFKRFHPLPPVTRWRPSSLETVPREKDQADDSSSKRPKPSEPIDIPKRRRMPTWENQ
ncbi:hypothetical protein CDAR_58572 [Caerostris darwini]|uniref:Uncharacterized protein n=1 Tax=Caerostris darwini TaxID=1538125 RepID=A0AAV4U749_9ARAC|nr:hypothetical protein CDAR_58572 [Caerostris darwini]